MDTIIASPSRKRGRPRTDSIDRLRLRVWYLAVRAKSAGKTDYWLDLRLARPKPVKNERADKRKRLFQRIRTRGVANIQGWQGGVDGEGAFEDSLTALIERVERFNEEGVCLRGTAAYFYSPLWLVLQNQSDNSTSVRELVAKCLEQLGLARPTLMMEVKFGDELEDLFKNREFDPEQDRYTQSLAEVTERMPNPLDAAALVMALMKEAGSVGNWSQRDRLAFDVLDRQIARIEALEGADPQNRQSEIVQVRSIVGPQFAPRGKSRTDSPDDVLFGRSPAKLGGESPPRRLVLPNLSNTTIRDLPPRSIERTNRVDSDLVKAIKSYRDNWLARTTRLPLPEEVPPVIDARRPLVHIDDRWKQLKLKAEGIRGSMKDYVSFRASPDVEKISSLGRRPEPDLSDFWRISQKFRLPPHPDPPKFLPEARKKQD